MRTSLFTLLLLSSFSLRAQSLGVNSGPNAIVPPNSATVAPAPPAGSTFSGPSAISSPNTNTTLGTTPVTPIPIPGTGPLNDPNSVQRQEAIPFNNGFDNTFTPTTPAAPATTPLPTVPATPNSGFGSPGFGTGSGTGTTAPSGSGFDSGSGVNFGP